MTINHFAQGPDETNMAYWERCARVLPGLLDELAAKEVALEHQDGVIRDAKELIRTYENAMVATGIATEEYDEVWYGDRFSHYTTIVCPTDETMLMIAWDEALLENSQYDRKHLANDPAPF